MLHAKNITLVVTNVMLFNKPVVAGREFVIPLVFKGISAVRYQAAVFVHVRAVVTQRS